MLDRDIPGPSGDEIAEHIIASGSGMPILMLTVAAKALTVFRLHAPFESTHKVGG